MLTDDSTASRYGPIFIGVVLNIALYGIMVTQTYLYFHVYKRYVPRPFSFDGSLDLETTLCCDTTGTGRG